MTPNQLPPLPPPDRTMHQYGKQIDHFTADQMHAYALAALAQQAQEPVDEQAEFEASMREKHGWVARDFQSDSFGYFDGHTATAWLAWQARAALQSPAPQAGGWLPIETAPRGSGENGPRSVNDPSYVKPPDLLLIHPEGISVGYYDWYYHPGYGVGASPYEPVWRSRPDGEGLDGVTHWQPLPPAPQTKGQS